LRQSVSNRLNKGVTDQLSIAGYQNKPLSSGRGCDDPISWVRVKWGGQSKGILNNGQGYVDDPPPVQVHVPIEPDLPVRIQLESTTLLQAGQLRALDRRDEYLRINMHHNAAGRV
jgi:hypothetical protein